MRIKATVKVQKNIIQKVRDAIEQKLKFIKCILNIAILGTQTKL